MELVPIVEVQLILYKDNANRTQWSRKQVGFLRLCAVGRFIEAIAVIAVIEAIDIIAYTAQPLNRPTA